MWLKSLHLLLFSAMSLIVTGSSNLSKDDLDAINAIDELNKFIDLINANDFDRMVLHDEFINKADKFATAAPKILKAIKGAIGGGDVGSKFVTLANKLSKYTVGFGQAREIIDYQEIRRTNLAKYELSLRSLMNNFVTFVAGHGGDLEAFFANQFLISYKSDFSMATFEMHHLFTDIMLAVRKGSQEYRRKVREFGLGMLQLMTQGIILDTAYSTLAPMNEDGLNRVFRDSVKKLTDVAHILKTHDKFVADQWNVQSKLDIENALKAETSLRHSDFVNKLHALLSDKYYWRHWFIASHNPLSVDSGKFAMTFCNGGRLVNQNGRNVVWSSLSKSESIFQPEKAEKLLQEIKFQENSALGVLTAITSANMPLCSAADKAFSVGPYPLRLVVTSDSDLNTKADTDHFKMHKVTLGGLFTKKTYTIVLFG